jgi:acyl-CoA thioesterase
MGNPFFEATTVRRVEPGRYAAELDERWNLRPLPQGGIVTALAVRAMQDALDRPDQKPRTLHTTFAGQVAHGPLEVDVEVLRAGRTMSQVRGEVRNQGSDRGHLTTCVFGRSRRGFERDGGPALRPPTGYPRPDTSRSHRRPPPEVQAEWQPMPFWTELVENRVALGHLPWDNYVPDSSEKVIWYRFDEPPVLDDGRLDPLALIVLVDTMPGAIGEMIGPTEQPWFAPSVDLTVHLLGDCRSTWVLGHNRAHHLGDGYASAEMTLWDCGPDGDGEPRLVAFATQLFLFTFLD